MQDADDLHIRVHEAIKQNMGAAGEAPIPFANMGTWLSQLRLGGDKGHGLGKPAYVSFGLIRVPLSRRVIPNLAEIVLGKKGKASTGPSCRRGTAIPLSRNETLKVERHRLPACLSLNQGGAKRG